MASALAGELTDADAEAWVARLNVLVSDSPLGGPTQAAVPVPPEVLRDMWRSERGRAVAWELIFRSRPYPEWSRSGMALIAWEISRRDAFGGKLTADQDAVLWETWQRVLEMG